MHIGVAALSLMLAFTNYQLPIAGYFYFDEEIVPRAGAGVFLAIGVTWLLGGLILAWGLRAPDHVAFDAAHDTTLEPLSPAAAKISPQ